MKIQVNRLMPALLMAAAGAVAQAQTTAPAPAKPAAKTTVKAAAKPASSVTGAAGGKTNVMGGHGTGSGPILTRDELRTCLSQEELIRKKLDDHAALRAPLDQEKATLATEQQNLKTERAPLDTLKTEADALSLKFKAYGDRISAWNERVAAFNSANPSGTRGDRERAALNKDREDLAVEQKALEAEKNDFGVRSDALVKDFNAKAARVDARVADWNQRNNAWNEGSKALEGERSGWVSSCSERRYREDDETAIRNGK